MVANARMMASLRWCQENQCPLPKLRWRIAQTTAWQTNWTRLVLPTCAALLWKLKSYRLSGWCLILLTLVLSPLCLDVNSRLYSWQFTYYSFHALEASCLMSWPGLCRNTGTGIHRACSGQVHSLLHKCGCRSCNLFRLFNRNLRNSHIDMNHPRWANYPGLTLWLNAFFSVLIQMPLTYVWPRLLGAG